MDLQCVELPDFATSGCIFNACIRICCCRWLQTHRRESGHVTVPSHSAFQLTHLSNHFLCTAMRNLVIYLSALTTLLPSNALRHGSHQLRDLLAFPKYQIDYLNELPLSSSDAKACLRDGVEFESDFTQTRFEGRKHVSGNDTKGEQGAKVSLEFDEELMVVGNSTHETTLSRWITST